MIARIGFADSSAGLRHALGFIRELRHRVIVNKEPVVRVAKSLGLDAEQAAGVVRLLRAAPTLSPERAALVAMRDPGLDDADVAVIFGRTKNWARLVRERAEEIRAAEPVSDWLEWLDAGLQPGDPTPEEIQAIAAELRRLPNCLRAPESQKSIPTYQWTGHAFIPIGAY